MQIVIDIDPVDYEYIKNGCIIPMKIDNHIYVAIRNGTLLPKGHGDLIDKRELKKDVYTTTEWNGDIHKIIYEASVDYAPIVIEADKERRK